MVAGVGVVEVAPLMRAVAVLLTAQTGKPAGEGAAPDGCTRDEGWYVVDYVSQMPSTSSLAHPHECAAVVLQVSSEGSDSWHALHLADDARAVLLGQGTVGLFVADAHGFTHPLVVDGASVIGRQHDGSSAQEGGGTVRGTADRYTFEVQKA